MPSNLNIEPDREGPGVVDEVLDTIEDTEVMIVVEDLSTMMVWKHMTGAEHLAGAGGKEKPPRTN